MALIECVECQNRISDKAYSCPHCGYPLNPMPMMVQASKPVRSRKKYSRMPNHYGSIRNLGGGRRKPYAVYPPVTQYKDNGTAILPKALGYFETYNQALECLALYNNNPQEINARITFEEVYQEYYDDKYLRNKKKTYSASSIRSCQSAFANLAELHKMPIADLRTSQMQNCIDNCSLKHASLELMVGLLKQVSKFALQRDYIKKDYAQFVRVNVPDDDEKGVPFTETEIKKLWENKDDYSVKIILIMVYTGMRISELEKLEMHLDEGYVVGGVKTKAGKNRIIPVHKAIAPFMNDIGDDFNGSRFRDEYFHATMARLGMSKASTGERHTPHDCRHTFSWLADKFKIDSLAKHLIMGHSVSKMDIELSTYGHRTKEELIAEISKIKIDTV